MSAMLQEAQAAEVHCGVSFCLSSLTVCTASLTAPSLQQEVLLGGHASTLVACTAYCCTYCRLIYHMLHIKHGQFPSRGSSTRLVRLLPLDISIAGSYSKAPTDHVVLKPLDNQAGVQDDQADQSSEFAVPFWAEIHEAEASEVEVLVFLCLYLCVTMSKQN